MRKRCEDLKLLRCLIRPSLRYEKYRSFLFSRLDRSGKETRIKLAQAIVDKDDAKLSQRGAMTLVIELDQHFDRVTQVDRRAHSSWWILSNEWLLKKIEARK